MTLGEMHTGLVDQQPQVARLNYRRSNRPANARLPKPRISKRLQAGVERSRFFRTRSSPIS
jgi:hypothetical protein